MLTYSPVVRLACGQLAVGVVGFNVPLDTLQLISETILRVM